jgi:hypothetical protein
MVTNRTPNPEAQVRFLHGLPRARRPTGRRCVRNAETAVRIRSGPLGNDTAERRRPGISSNGKTRGWQSRNAGSIPAISTIAIQADGAEAQTHGKKTARPLYGEKDDSDRTEAVRLIKLRSLVTQETLVRIQFAIVEGPSSNGKTSALRAENVSSILSGSTPP